MFGSSIIPPCESNKISLLLRGHLRTLILKVIQYTLNHFIQSWNKTTIYNRHQNKCKYYKGLISVSKYNQVLHLPYLQIRICKNIIDHHKLVITQCSCELPSTHFSHKVVKDSDFMTIHVTNSQHPHQIHSTPNTI